MKYTVPVRFGLMATTENFISDTGDLRVGDDVIVRTARGVEAGQVAGPPQALAHEAKGLGELLRAATATDQAISLHNRETKEPEEFQAAQACIRERKLPMRLVGVEHLFSGDKVVFYFLADGRVDFRELVKDLARRYRTRIEMRQIGVRDEARLLADYEHCGRELCCRTFIRTLEPVTMRMAKTQKTTLDPSKISGHCGRLMCCLRFEDAVYSRLQQDLPPKGTVCVTERFTGEVAGQDILRQTVTLALGDGTNETVHVSEIVERRGRRQKEKENRPKDRPAGPPPRSSAPDGN